MVPQEERGDSGSCLILIAIGDKGRDMPGIAVYRVASLDWLEVEGLCPLLVGTNGEGSGSADEPGGEYGLANVGVGGKDLVSLEGPSWQVGHGKDGDQGEGWKVERRRKVTLSGEERSDQAVADRMRHQGVTTFQSSKCNTASTTLSSTPTPTRRHDGL